MRKRYLLTTSVLIMGLLTASPGWSQSLDNKGTDFLMTFLPNYDASVVIELHLTSEVSTTVTVEYPVDTPTFTTSVAVNPGAITIVGLPITTATGWTPGIVQNNAVSAFADDEFVAYMINRRTASSDAALALPVDTMNTEYIVTTYRSNIVSEDRGEFAVVAGFDNTTVTITPTNNLAGGFPANVPFNVVLNRGEAFLAQSTTNGAAGDLTGSVVTADRPVGMTNGNKCTNVPPGTTACDHIFEVAQPTQTWGQQAFVANLPNRPNGSVYRIVASVDGTTVTQDGASIGNINRGQFIEVGPLPGAHVFAGDQPIFVTQFMTGQSYPGATLGDPAQGNMIPAEQYLPAYTFSTVGGGQFAENYVTIIAKDADVGSLTLDGVAIAAADYTPIGASGYSYTIKPLTSGAHTTASTNGHGITVEGYNSFDSYLYPGGALFRFINPVGDANPPICQFTVSGGPPETGSGSARDDRPTEDTNGNGILDPGEDLNGNGLIDEDTGIFFVQLDAGATNLTLNVAPFVPGDPLVTFTVELTDTSQDGSGTVTATDGAGNTCSVPVTLSSVPPVPPSPTPAISPLGLVILSGLLALIGVGMRRRKV